MRILVVEDEPRLLRSLTKALREEGYAVDTSREFELSASTQDLFDETQPNAAYFAVWSRDGHTVEACLDTAQQMRRLTESLLELARLDAGQANLSREKVDLARLAKTCLARIEPLARQRELRIQCELEPATVLGDTGPGVGPEDLPHVFEQFYRGDAARSSAQGHVGLGLAIAKAIVEAHNGQIFVTSQPGQGTEFIVRIPAPTSAS